MVGAARRVKRRICEARLQLGALGLALASALVLSAYPGEAASIGPVGSRLPAAVTPVANWRNPYGNVDRRWDAGNDTGDAMVDRLNQQQLNRIKRGGDYPRPRRHRPPPGYYPGYRPPGY